MLSPTNSAPSTVVKILDSEFRSKYLEAYRSGTNLVLLNPDVAKVFPTEKAVHDAPRALIEFKV